MFFLYIVSKVTCLIIMLGNWRLRTRQWYQIIPFNSNEDTVVWFSFNHICDLQKYHFCNMISEKSEITHLLRVCAEWYINRIKLCSSPSNEPTVSVIRIPKLISQNWHYAISNDSSLSLCWQPCWDVCHCQLYQWIFLSTANTIYRYLTISMKCDYEKLAITFHRCDVGDT